MITLLACAELSETVKVNVELGFANGLPTAQQLRSEMTKVFTYESRVTVGTRNAFEVESITIYDDSLMQWVEFESHRQLHPYDQLYVFGVGIPPAVAGAGGAAGDNGLPPPKVSRYYSDPDAGRIVAEAENLQRPKQAIPPPTITTPSSSSSSGGQHNQTAVASAPPSHHQNGGRADAPVLRGSASSTMAPAPAAAGGSSGVTRGSGGGGTSAVTAATPDDDVLYVFRLGATHDSQRLSRDEFFALLARIDVRLDSRLVSEMFDLAAGGAATITYDGFHSWAQRHPRMFEVVFDRLREEDIVVVKRKELSQLTQSLQEAAERRLRLEDELRAIQEQTSLNEEKAAVIGETLRQLESQEYRLQREEELVVVEKEVRLATHRALLEREEREYQTVARDFDSRKRSTSVSSSTGATRQQQQQYNQRSTSRQSDYNQQGEVYSATPSSHQQQQQQQQHHTVYVTPQQRQPESY